MKQTKANKHMELLSFMVYGKEPKLSVVRHLTEYLERTQVFQKTNNLLLTCIKPHKTATKGTVSRWCKYLLKDGGINIDNYIPIDLELQQRHMQNHMVHLYERLDEV